MSEDTARVDQQLVVHLFAPADGPRAEAAYAALRQTWAGCRQFFLMRDPIPGTGLADQLPREQRALPATEMEAALAAQERPDADCQAILRRHHDVLNMSVVLAPPATAQAPASGHSWWQELDSQWDFLSGQFTADLLGEARIYLARSAVPPGPRLNDRLPSAARIEDWRQDVAARDGPLALWEAPPWTDHRTLRRLVLAFADDDQADLLASAWAWSRGDVAIPPLARYLLHAARLRYQYRVWQRDSTTRAFIARVRQEVAALRDVSAGQPALAGEPDCRASLDRSAREARLMSADLRELRRSTEIAAHNMGLVISAEGLLSAGSPFTNDRDLARSFLARLDDELCYLDIAADRAAEPAPALPRPEPAPEATLPPARQAAARSARQVPPDVADDAQRSVFVVHGRDEQARAALFGFLEALGLRPLDWESLVEATGSASPYLRDVITSGIAMAQAAVVLMTPDDVVWLHHSLHAADEDDYEGQPAMQARPNVILELGMALATYADRTIVLFAGKHRPMADLGGLNYIRLTDSDECLDKVMRRLRTARCRVRDDGPGWRGRAWFSHLAAYTRRPGPQPGPAGWGAAGRGAAGWGAADRGAADRDPADRDPAG